MPQQQQFEILKGKVTFRSDDLQQLLTEISAWIESKPEFVNLDIAIILHAEGDWHYFGSITYSYKTISKG
jgi:hypothetical protein